MRATLNLSLVNKESMHFFTKKLSNDESLYEGAVRKINLLIKMSINYNAKALVITYKLDEKVKSSIEYLYDELDKFEGQLEKRQVLGTKKINFITQHSPEVSCSNPLLVSLIEWVEVFDKLISTLKVLNLSGCFESRDAFYLVKRRYQKLANCLLSAIVVQPAASLATNSVQEVIESESQYDWQTLYEAMKSSFSPGFSQPAKHQFLYRLKQKSASNPNSLKKELSC